MWAYIFVFLQIQTLHLSQLSQSCNLFSKKTKNEESRNSLNALSSVLNHGIFLVHESISRIHKYQLTTVIKNVTMLSFVECWWNLETVPKHRGVYLCASSPFHLYQLQATVVITLDYHKHNLLTCWTATYGAFGVVFISYKRGT